MTLGLKQAGFKVIGAVDIDELSVTTYKNNHPDVHVWNNDIRSLEAAEVRRKLGLKRGELELLAGCPPCQGFSSVRTRNGSVRPRDDRNDLIYDFLRFARTLRPKTLMMENVPGLIRDRRIRDLRRGLERLGYKIHLEIADASNFGVPQRRRRLILVGSTKGLVPVPARSKLKKTVRDTIAHLPKPGSSGDPCHDVTEERSQRVLDLIRKIPKNGGSRGHLGKRAQLKCHRNFSGFGDVYGRMRWDDVSPTITGGCVNPSKGRFLHPVQNRCITIREAALLQSFPPDYFFSLSRGKYPAAQLVGNALPPEFIRRHALQISAFLKG